jgi:hypothetical protein
MLSAGKTKGPMVSRPQNKTFFSLGVKSHSFHQDMVENNWSSWKWNNQVIPKNLYIVI